MMIDAPRSLRVSVLAVLATAGSALAHEPEQARRAPTLDDPGVWRAAERETLRNHVRLTDPALFSKAGEAYFDRAMRRVIFQAIPKGDWDTGASTEHYSMYVADIALDSSGYPSGLANIVRVSPDGSSNTCGWFHPTDKWTVLFGSTIEPPSSAPTSGYQRNSRDYVWQFPAQMEVVEVRLPGAPPIEGGVAIKDSCYSFGAAPMTLRRVFERAGYDAECSYSGDGRFVLYANVPEGTNDGDIHVFDTKTGAHTALVVAPGYDGGPFFSRDGKYITYRSDRAGNDLLQVYVAKLAFGEGGAITGIEWERPVTANGHVNWGPYWSRDGGYLVYSTSEVGHHNYEVFAAPSNTGAMAREPGELAHKRVTFAAGFDGLPVFSDNGRWMLWTSQRRAEGDAPDFAPGSQVWAARVVGAKPE
jgi:hypothetical protein